MTGCDSAGAIPTGGVSDIWLRTGAGFWTAVNLLKSYAMEIWVLTTDPTMGYKHIEASQSHDAGHGTGRSRLA